MLPRTAAILEATIRHYVETGEPVSSQQLAAAHGFGVRAATIRNELNALTGDGFLAQPHTSGGRVPTDKGYRFMVERLLKERGSTHSTGSTGSLQASLGQASSPSSTGGNRETHEAAALTRDLARGQFAAFIEDLAGDFNLLGVGYGPVRQTVYKRGLDELFDQIVSFGDVESLGELAAIAADFEAMDDRMGMLFKELTGELPTVFIGKSPITRSRHLSVVADRFDCAGEVFMAAVVGPKRMRYDDVITLFAEVRRAMR